MTKYLSKILRGYYLVDLRFFSKKGCLSLNLVFVWKFLVWKKEKLIKGFIKMSVSNHTMVLQSEVE